MPVPETCNALDDDCDGRIDEATETACYGGPEGSDRIGRCRAGVARCVAGVLGACVGEQRPIAERCDNHDDDCDGLIDEDFESVGEPCAVGTGACRAEGVGVCHPDGEHTLCAGTPASATAETCDGVDEDCDGSVDEGLTRECDPAPDHGPCRSGISVCNDGGWSDCMGAVAPSDERCNAVDDDCDGSVDEGLQVACYAGAPGTEGVGVCRAGIETCVGGRWSACDARTPEDERCDGLDEDCDGQVDEMLAGCECEPGTSRPCYAGPAGTAGAGRCRSGTQWCTDALVWGACEGEVRPAVERCDGRDDDCDGRVDEFVLDDETVCQVGVGACLQTGRLVCLGADGVACGAVAGEPAVEACNAVDDDCDGSLDEGLAPEGECTVGVGACARAGQLRCVDGLQDCDVEPGPMAVEVCDGRDNDCDGAVDESDPRLALACDSGEAGACRQGVNRCVAGELRCAPTEAPRPERCDGRDDDCDGLVDEGGDGMPLAEPCYAGPADTEGIGVCAAGQRTCQAGVMGACVGQVGPRAERCDGLDEDCDGRVDESAEGACVCEPGASRPCYAGPPDTQDRGVCRAGVETCQADGLHYGACVDQVLPGAETCDGRDEDCDGTIDEVPGLGAGCSVGRGQCRRDGQLVCDGPRLGCDALEGEPALEVCDRLDNDCDGAVDELDGLGVECAAGLGECRTAGVQICDFNSGDLACNARPSAPEAADRCAGSLDEDCDGVVDEGDDCAAEASCVPADDDRVCQCPPGTSGDGFECAEIDDCAPAPCGPGTCTDRRGGFECDCTGTPFTGPRCADDRDECADGAHDCGDDRRCVNTHGGFACVCPEAALDVGEVCVPCALEHRRYVYTEAWKTALTWPTALIAEDLDGDGRPDLVLETHRDRVVWMRNLGGFRFGAPERISPADILVQDYRVADLTGDGRPDFIIHGWIAPRTQTMILHRVGDAYVEAGRGARLYGEPADLDGDGLTDLVAGGSTIGWSRNVGGLLERQPDLDGVVGRHIVRFVDVDLDGVGDLLTADSENHVLRWSRNLGGGVFDAFAVLIENFRYDGFVAEDIDGDAQQDLLFAWAFDTHLQRALLDPMRPGVERIADAPCDAIMEVVDLDGDGRRELLCHGPNDAHRFEVGDDMQLRNRLRVARRANRRAFADFDGDGLVDVATTNYREAGDVTIQPGLPGASVYPYWAVQRNGQGPLLVDIDLDGHLDVLRTSSEAVWVDRGLGSGGFRHEMLAPMTVDDTPSYFELRDLDGDGEPDLIYATRTALHWRPMVAGVAQAAQAIDFPNWALGLQLGDLDADGDIDLVTVATDRNLAWQENDGAGNFAAPRVIAVGDWSTPHLVDLDRDGDLDLVVGEREFDEVRWYENDGRAGFAAHVLIPEMAQLDGIISGDVGADGDVDLMIRGHMLGVGRVKTFYEQVAPLEFVAHPFPGEPVFQTHAFHDVDRDGAVDLLVSYDNIPASVRWYRWHQGRFEDARLLLEGESLSRMQIGDLDGDGIDDFLGLYRWLKGDPRCAE